MPEKKRGYEIPTTNPDTQSDLDTLLGGGTSPRPSKKAARPAGPSAAERKFNAYVDPEIQERIRRAQFWTQTSDDGYRTLSDLVEAVLLAEAERLEREHNAGEPFREIPDGKLRSGRPSGR